MTLLRGTIKWLGTDVIEIPLTYGKYATIDSRDYELVAPYNWCVTPYGYAIRRYNHKIIWMHREINQTPDNLTTDHINGNTLDNRRKNLRSCNDHQNQANRGVSSSNTSGIKGVYWNKERRKWQARIKVYYKSIYLGRYDNIDEAARAYREAALKYFGEFSNASTAA